ncbi:hypothetical protein J7337_010985 [Fusarium musae]|uniref:Uncharacterized protein n=1 Tax=Fusarium musae TaxID=1042133 RepID=A0A9P8ILQ9_9HYPO|nr:hypothetical protein J7337_010985 [Fusarium musae]KAG9498094.1 hypothetical protein J7337_010985 [Fusarium musae]
MEDIPAGSPQPISCSTTSFEILAANPATTEPQRFHNSEFWGSRTFRYTYALVLLALLGLALSFMIPQGDTFYTTTTFVVIIFYLGVIGMSALITTWYMGITGAKSTVLPCISSTWYKFYTGVLLGFGIAVIVIACIETRKTPCGKFTSGPGIQADLLACLRGKFDKTEHHDIVDGPYNGTISYGFQRPNNASYVVAYYEDDQQNVFNFTRMCFSTGRGGNLQPWLKEKSMTRTYYDPKSDKDREV